MPAPLEPKLGLTITLSLPSSHAARAAGRPVKVSGTGSAAWRQRLANKCLFFSGLAASGNAPGFSRRWMPFRRSEEHTSELQSLMRSSYAVFCLKKKNEKETAIIQKQQATAQ